KRAASASAATPVPAGDSGRPHSYDRHVADGDRAIENGQTAKAQKLYEEALHLQPNGVAALTGNAYVLLDRHKALSAIDTFKRALNLSPGYAPALFGLAEAYRLEGEPAQAVAAYKRYLESSPSGTDAPAARRQIRELEGQTSARAATEPPTAP
ncbi:MAG TPA: tetratricopeptide repeat protein, partial [Polyangia bacterium]|nr:tetratricopeptide repeat protein [Polyangia bacterium]